MHQKLRTASLVSVGVVAGVLVSVGISAVAQRQQPEALPLSELRQFTEVFGAIKNFYVEPVGDDKLFNGAISGMVSNLDPHSSYLDAEAFKELRVGTQGEFGGLGIEVGTEDGFVKVIAPIEDTPAQKAGVKAGDLIVKIDDKPTKGMSLSDAVGMMRGKPKTEIKLTLLRKNEDKPIVVTIVRDVIRVQSVKAKMLDGGYGYVRITQFQEHTGEYLAKALNKLQAEKPMKGLVLDLRNDPGGLLDAAVAVSAAFLPENVTVVSTNGQLEESKFTYKTSPQFWRRNASNDPIGKLTQATGGALKKVPLVVLVNEGSASASEIVAGALQDHKRATLMGSQTFGKGSVQTVRQLGPDTALKITTARYYTPNGRAIQAKGIVPDVMLDETENGNVFAALRTREADLQKHLSNGKEEEKKDPEREKAREEALKKLEEESKKPVAERRLPEFGSDKDFQLAQAIKQLKGQPVKASTTLAERKVEKKED